MRPLCGCDLFFSLFLSIFLLDDLQKKKKAGSSLRFISPKIDEGVVETRISQIPVIIFPKPMRRVYTIPRQTISLWNIWVIGIENPIDAFFLYLNYSQFPGKYDRKKTYEEERLQDPVERLLAEVLKDLFARWNRVRSLSSFVLA